MDRRKTNRLIQDVRSYQKPSISSVLVADIYLHQDKTVTIGRENHKYLKEQLLTGQVAFNLDEGFDDWIQDPEAVDKDGKRILHTHLGTTQRYLKLKADQLQSNNLKQITQNANVVCRQSCLTAIATAPYHEDNTVLRFLVEKFEGILFMTQLGTYERMGKEKNLAAHLKRMIYWGLNFENYLFSGSGGSTSQEFKVNTRNDIMCALFNTTFHATSNKEELTVLHCSEIDGLDSQGNHIEAKTQAYKLFNNERFSFKAMKWWIQCKLANISEVVVGFRNNNGLCYKVEKVSVEQLRQSCSNWDGSICINEIQAVLNEIRRRYDDMVGPDQRLIVEKIKGEENLKYEIMPATEMTILTPEFIKKFGTPLPE